jgi:formate dehydrogenase subunit gamma
MKVTTQRNKRIVIVTLVALVIVAIGLLSRSLVEPAGAHPGYSCNPPAGHGSPGCHHSSTATTKPKTTTTKPKVTTTVKPTTTAGSTAVDSTTTATAAPGTTPAATTASLDTTTEAADPSTTLDPTTSEPDSTDTTDLSESVAAMVANGVGGGGGPGGGWIALMIGLGALAGAGWALLAARWARSRRDRGGAVAAQGGPLRFVLAERLAHWVYASCFLAAGVTGALMWIPSTAQGMAEAYYSVARSHGYLGLAMVTVPLTIFLVLDRRRLAENRRALGQWGVHDRRWLRAAFAGRLFRGKRMPPQGRFNAGQKINSYVVAGLTLAFLITGSLLMARSHLPAGLVSGVLLGHKVLATAGATLVLAHVGMAVLTRHGRGGLKAMVRGILPAHVAREGHLLWYAEWLQQRGRENPGL